MFCKERNTSDESNGHSRKGQRNINSQKPAVKNLGLLLKLDNLNQVRFWLKFNLFEQIDHIMKVNCCCKDVKWHENHESSNSYQNIAYSWHNKLQSDLIPNIRNKNDVEHLQWVDDLWLTVTKITQAIIVIRVYVEGFINFSELINKISYKGEYSSIK